MHFDGCRSFLVFLFSNKEEMDVVVEGRMSVSQGYLERGKREIERDAQENEGFELDIGVNVVERKRMDGFLRVRRGCM
jgi:hypothetical protein